MRSTVRRAAQLKRTAKIDFNVAQDVGPLRQDQTLPRVLTVDEVFRLLGVVDTATAAGARDKAILETLYGTGIRCSELTALNLTDVDFDGKTIFVRHGKGDRERLAVLGSVNQAALEFYLLYRPILSHPVTGQHPNAVFLNTRCGRLSARSIQRIVASWGYVAGLGRVHPHVLRHSFVTHLRSSGADLRCTQLLAGHSSVNTTAKYDHVCVDRLFALYNRAHPRAMAPEAYTKPTALERMLYKPLYRRRKSPPGANGPPEKER